MIFGFFKAHKSRGFNYRPMYFDAEKERREERKRELGLSTDPSLPGSSGYHFKERWQQSRGKKSVRRKATLLTTLIYIVILILLLYFFLS